MDQRDWLSKLCLHDHSRPLARQPWSVRVVSGERWTAATNTRCIVYVRGGDWPYPTEADHVRLCHCWEPQAPLLEPVSLADLRAFLGPPLWQEPCPQCHGKGRPAENPDFDWEEDWCDYCESERTVSARRREGYLCGVPVDREMLAQFTASVTGTDAAVYGLPDETERPALWLVADDWRLCAAPIITNPQYPNWLGAPRLGEVDAWGASR